MKEDVKAYRGSGEDDSSADEYQSYFVDAVYWMVKEDLQTKLGYSESMAEQLLLTGGLKIITTLDPEIQAKMDAVFLDEENFPGGLGNDGTYPQASMVLMDPYTGHVLALYGGRGAKEGDLVLTMGGGDERLGKKLMKAFIFALTSQDEAPDKVICYNTGAYLTTRDPDTVKDLRRLADAGALAGSGLQDALAHADEVRRGLHQLIGFDVFDGALHVVLPKPEAAGGGERRALRGGNTGEQTV